jgi:hypothetical protein
MEVLIDIALGMGQMEKESLTLNLLLSVCVCVCVHTSVSSHVSRCDSWKMCLRAISSFLNGLSSKPSPFSEEEGKEKNAGLMVNFLASFQDLKSLAQRSEGAYIDFWHQLMHTRWGRCLAAAATHCLPIRVPIA